MATPGWTEKKRSSAPMRRGGDPQKIYWEGINLNKISKKIVSAVTMGAFALTLVPAAAFAGTAGVDTTVAVDGTQKIPAGSSITVDVNVGNSDTGEGITLWVQKDGVPGIYDEATYEVTAGTVTEYDTANGPFAGMFSMSSATAQEVSVAITVPETGNYTVFSAVNDENTAQTAEALTPISVTDGNITVRPATELDTSRLLYKGDTAAVSATQNKPFDLEFDVRDAAGADSKFALGAYTYVWVEDANGPPIDDVVVANAVDKGNGLYLLNTTAEDEDPLTVTITRAGEGFTVHAGVAATNAQTGLKGITEIDPITVNVAAAEVETSAITIEDVTSATPVSSSADTNNTIKVEYEIKDDVTPSDTKVYTVTGKAWQDVDQTIPAGGEKLAVSADKGLNLGGLDEGTVTTKANGEFEFTFTLEDAASYDITIREVNGEATTILTIVQDDVDAVDIEKVKDGGYVLAGTDIDYAGQVYGHGDVYLSDAVQFAITDAYGREAMGPGPLADEAAADATAQNHADSLEIKGQPEKTVNSDDFELAWDKAAGVYTLAYVDVDGDGAAKDLIPGEYSVRVALNNGGKQAVTVNFTVAEFGEVQELVLDTTAHAGQSWEANDNAITAIDDQVALGQWVNVVPKYVDANGLKVKADISDLQVGINGDAVIDRHITKDTIAFRVANNTAANNDYVGSVITIKVNDTTTNKYVEKELTVVKNYQAETVSIDPTQGVVGEPNTVNVTVVAGEEISKVNGKLSATIVSQSDEEANVDLKVNPDVRNGKASMYLESDKAGTVDVRVVVTANNGELYADTFTYTFGDEDPYAGSYVVMTIGSDQYLINNKVLDGSVDNLGAPYVDSAWRTMVPVRVLAESFGAEVTFDEEAQTVTIVDGDTTIVMTVGSTEYTINGEAAEAMDTAPVIGSDNRTYVPVRFVAEGLGYEVTPLYNAENGTTASVVFQK